MTTNDLLRRFLRGVAPARGTSELALWGTIALAGGTSWSDYRVTVRLHSDGDDAIGVVVRYVDGDNWYRFSMNRKRSYRRLVKCLNGSVSLLWEDDVRYTHGREYLLTIDVIGDAILGYLNGIELSRYETAIEVRAP
jgi:hypothetical protein